MTEHESMGQERPAPGDHRTVTLERAAPGGEAVARTPSGTVFVTGGLPSERVVVELTEVHKRFARGTVVEVREASPHRVPDRRERLGASGVGGMEYAMADVSYSRELKAQAAADQLERIGGLQWPGDGPLVHAAPREAAREGVRGDGMVGAVGTDWRIGTDWRTRVQLAVDTDGRPGMYAAGSHRILPVEHVPLAASALDELGIQGLCLPGAQRVELALGSRDGARDAARSQQTGAIVVTGPVEEGALALVKDLAEERDWSLVHRRVGQRNRGGHRTRGRGKKARRGGRGATTVESAPTLITGSGCLTQRVGGLDFRVRADGFWQVHADAATVLSDAVVERAAGAGEVVDLYCGAGLFSLRLATRGVRVHGVEGSPGAVADARANAERLLSTGSDDRGEADFTVARIETLPTLTSADTIIADPPRAGLGRGVTDLITASPAEKLVYVSCDGGTLARDAKALTSGGFRLHSLVAHDLFPLTGHLEFVSEFVR